MIYYRTRISFLLFAILIFATAVEIFAAAGDLDLTFWEDGILAADHGFDNESIVDLAVQPDGKIIVVGNSFNNSSSARRILFARYNPNGSLDTTFGTNGRVSIESRNPGELALQPDGKIVFVSPVGTSSSGNFYVGRLNSNGSLDTTFNGTGIIDMNLRGTNDSADSVKIQPDGKIVVAGISSRAGTSSTLYDFALVRFNTDGSLDTSFDGDGKVFTTAPEGQYIEFSDFVVQPDGKMIVAGRLLTYLEGNLDFLDFFIVRYNSNGSLDTAFDGDGIVTTRFTPQPPATRAWGSPSKVLVRPDGKIVVVGFVSIRGPNEFTMVAAARYNPDGSLDTAFGNDGKAMISYPTFNTLVPIDAALQTDNKIVIGGYAYFGSVAGTHAPLVRLTADGALDTSFSGDGVSGLISPTGKSAVANAVAIQPNGKILIGGLISWGNSGSDFMIARFEAVTCTMNCFVPRREVIADFDGDEKTDISVFRPSNATWYILPSSANNPNVGSAVQFVSQPEYLTPADFDGDGKTDIAVWHNLFSSSARYFNILRSTTNTVRVVQFGHAGDDPRVVGDWDGDGRADPAVYRRGASAGAQSFFFYLPSTQPTAGFATIYWGTAGDEAVRGDFDGDGRKDAAVFRPSDGVWYVLQSSNNQMRYQQWGLASDKRVPADYDGDGKTDFAIYRNGLWAVLQSSDNQQHYQQWGGLGADRPIAGDYDGDGKTDIAVWRERVFYILRSSDSQPDYRYLGVFNDIPIASAFVQ